MIIISIIITGLGVYALNRITPFSAWNLGLPGAIFDEITAQENLWSVLSSCLLQGTEIFPLALSSRTLIVLFWTAVVIFHALWQAEMTAYMSRTYLKPSVRSLHELAYGNTFRPIAMTGSSIFVSFNVSPPELQRNWPKCCGVRSILDEDAPDIPEQVQVVRTHGVDDPGWKATRTGQSTGSLQPDPERAWFAPGNRKVTSGGGAVNGCSRDLVFIHDELLLGQTLVTGLQTNAPPAKKIQ
ncbi:hypothetical protein FGIG_06053 [Fasciola gigantica]|uniref:Ionotropic glutamate receptor C-terminal domain-containing protein n=1 Tax=Fasciola gigantica TaxID=46835 RepID=A0A504ZBF5_FASGI|nr:hypothetical protein FGIG_06053 [Fasciola gigantica]